MSVFECKVSREPEHVRLSLYGELDIAAAPEVDEELAALERSRPDLIVLDLRGLTFLDSTGLRALLGADARAREEGRRVVLIQGPEPVQRVLSITGLDDRLDIVTDEAELAPGPG
jgi:anti-anti-sigma factor